MSSKIMDGFDDYMVGRWFEDSCLFARVEREIRQIATDARKVVMTSVGAAAVVSTMVGMPANAAATTFYSDSSRINQILKKASMSPSDVDLVPSGYIYKLTYKLKSAPRIPDDAAMNDPDSFF